MIKKCLMIGALALLPSTSLSHSMTPEFEVEYANSDRFYKTYIVSNEYDFPITLKIYVYNKDWTEADGWKSRKETFNLLPGSEKDVELRFRSVGVRKLIVCSVLEGIGYDKENPSLVSRVCSRLIINGVSGGSDNK